MTFQEFKELRLAGEQPGSMILLSVVGPIKSANTVVEIDLDSPPDMRPLLGIAVQIQHCGRRTPELIDLASDIVKVGPTHLSMFNVATNTTVVILDRGRLLLWRTQLGGI